jgi:hypothetical protein
MRGLVSPPVAHFLAERYLAGQDVASLALDTERIRAALGDLAGVQLLTTLYVPGDETCFYLFQSDSADLDGHAGEYDRVVPVVALAPQP